MLTRPAGLTDAHLVTVLRAAGISGRSVPSTGRSASAATTGR